MTMEDDACALCVARQVCGPAPYALVSANPATPTASVCRRKTMQPAAADDGGDPAHTDADQKSAQAVPLRRAAAHHAHRPATTAPRPTGAAQALPRRYSSDLHPKREARVAEWAGRMCRAMPRPPARRRVHRRPARGSHHNNKQGNKEGKKERRKRKETKEIEEERGERRGGSLQFHDIRLDAPARRRHGGWQQRSAAAKMKRSQRRERKKEKKKEQKGGKKKKRLKGLRKTNRRKPKIPSQRACVALFSNHAAIINEYLSSPQLCACWLPWDFLHPLEGNMITYESLD